MDVDEKVGETRADSGGVGTLREVAEPSEGAKPRAWAAIQDRRGWSTFHRENGHTMLLLPMASNDGRTCILSMAGRYVTLHQRDVAVVLDWMGAPAFDGGDL